ncbi:MAG TPA: PCYCGC motif-containing (lipo)protein [Anaerolineae bacterium]|nr:PCYCGC motif-containing (lipo)protein [Anaerolineae bacterium]
MKRIFALLLLTILSSPIWMLTACTSNGTPHEISMAPASAVPAEMQRAPIRIREAYQFALAYPEALKNVPCFCGCVKLGHTSNYDCYIQDAPNNGPVVFDQHALGCTICVDITQDVIRMTREGRAPPAIHRAIVSQYSQFGPSNQ